MTTAGHQSTPARLRTLAMAIRDAQQTALRDDDVEVAKLALDADDAMCRLYNALEKRATRCTTGD